MAKCPDEVNIEAILKKYMKENHVDPDEIPTEAPFDVDKFIENLKEKKNWSKRYFRGCAYGQFKCDNTLCGNSWSSPHAWCILDLKEQRVEMKFTQKCSFKTHKHMKQLGLQDEASPLEPDDEEAVVEPCYEDAESVRHMVEWAVNLYLYITKRKEREPTYHSSNYRPTPEHKEDLCEMCQRLGRLCFERKQN